MSLFLMRPTTESNEITHEENVWTYETLIKTRRHDGTKNTRPAMARD